MLTSILPRLLFACLLCLAGCAGAPMTKPGLPAGAGPAHSSFADARWHTSCFRMPFDADGRPVWARDLLLADRVLAPLLAAHRHDIALWRFHRRAAQDATGHQFSLLLYTRDTTYAAIRAAVDADPLVAGLLREGQLSRVEHGCRAAQSRPAIEATSDPAWDPAIQRSWPHFIMGVSASWLALVQEFAAAPPAQAPAFDIDPIGFYAAVDQRIKALWAGQGQHAYLHHLSGIYGYAPLRIQTWMQF